jgi:dihydropyrimidinase
LPCKDSGIETIDAQGAYVTPGGIDTHVHLSQLYEASADSLMKTQITDGKIPDLANYMHDTYDTGTRSAVAGGTTTVVTFASQLRDDDSLVPVVEEYHKLADGQSYCDYAFHIILSNPTKKILEEDLPMMVEKHGITSVKIYMTYKAFQLKDYEILDVLHATRKLGVTTMIHAENADVIDWMTEHLEEQGMTAPYHHGTSRPPIVEAEATVGFPILLINLPYFLSTYSCPLIAMQNRAISFAELMDAPVLLVHISGGHATRIIREAQTRLLPVYGETCPQYLFLLADSMKKEGFEGMNEIRKENKNHYISSAAKNLYKVLNASARPRFVKKLQTKRQSGLVSKMARSRRCHPIMPPSNMVLQEESCEVLLTEAVHKENSNISLTVFLVLKPASRCCSPVEFSRAASPHRSLLK